MGVDYAFALANGLGIKAYNATPAQSDASAHAFHSSEFHSPVEPDGIGAVCFSFITNCCQFSWFDDTMTYKEIVLMSLFAYYTLNIWRMVSCGGDVALAFRDRTIFLSVPSFKLAERLAIRTALDVVNAWFGMPKLSFRKRQERTLEGHFGSVKSTAPSQNPTFPGWQKASVEHNNRVVEESKKWTSQPQETRKPLTPEKLDEITDVALVAACVFMAKLCPHRFPCPKAGAVTLQAEFTVWTEAMEIVMGQNSHTVHEAAGIDSEEEEEVDHTLPSSIVDAAGAAADYHGVTASTDEPVLTAALTSTETAVEVGAVPGSGATQTPAPPAPVTVPGSGAASGPEGAAEAPITVPGSGAVVEPPVIAVERLPRSTAVVTMRETLAKIVGEDPLPKLVGQLVKFNKEVRASFGFGPKFSVGAKASSWNRWQHEVKISLPDQDGNAKRNTREGVFIQASKNAARVFHDSAIESGVAEMLVDVSAVTSFRPRAESRSKAVASKGPSDYLPQIVIALPGKVYMVGQIIVGGDGKTTRESKTCRQAIAPVERALVKQVRAFELEWRDERTLRLRFNAEAPILRSEDVVVQLKVEKKVYISTGITDFVLPSTLVGCKGRITSACERFIASRGDSADGPGDPTAKAKAKAGSKAKAVSKAKAHPKAAQGGAASVELVTHAPISTGSTISTEASSDQTSYGGRYDFGDGGRTQDGKVLIRKALRTLSLLFEKKFNKPFVVENCVSHPKVSALNWNKLVHKAPSYFESRYRSATASGKPCSRNEISVHIYSRLSRIQENLKNCKDNPFIDLIKDISQHGDEPIALLPLVPEMPEAS